MSDGARWSDLAPRVISGVAMAVVGAADIWIGGLVFEITVIGLCGIMLWEAANMFGAGRTAAVRISLLGAAAFTLASLGPLILVVPLLLAAALVGSSQVARERRLFTPFAAWILVAGYSIWMLRQEAGLIWISWVVLIVIASDIAGYFAGRTIGGPKFWPAVSPKKTWSGTIAGWVGAAVVGAFFAGPTQAGLLLIPISVAVAFAGQMGDILESFVKRRMSVKDSSNLIPGHGGVLDRLDALLGAAMLVMILWFTKALPGLT
ncbi:phosphatidate cytidylyltransferase [Roseovarius aestuarii]|uniref:Phosphatidate cytidylyltransferase n=1 Tax=Roseovarius aestuarii TaxID=475083 RepID=A0A1X7BQY0_9RHOB|nr:phosphatidate cytidylyltransferase [Roseovarius aestuarii]SMC11599.1 Phosphatidate cytidylyltransferase [Roseovarius aestuarii]